MKNQEKTYPTTHCDIFQRKTVALKKTRTDNKTNVRRGQLQKRFIYGKSTNDEK